MMFCYLRWVGRSFWIVLQSTVSLTLALDLRVKSHVTGFPNGLEWRAWISLWWHVRPRFRTIPTQTISRVVCRAKLLGCNLSLSYVFFRAKYRDTVLSAIARTPWRLVNRLTYLIYRYTCCYVVLFYRSLKTSQFTLLHPRRRLCSTRHLSVCLSVCLFVARKNSSDLRENFIADVSLDKQVHTEFWKSSGSGLWILTPNPDRINLGGGLSALVVCSFLRHAFSNSSLTW